MFNFLFGETAKSSMRAKRFAIRIPVHYRKPHTAQWFDGKTENISCSGVLFRAKCLLQPMTTIELKLQLPAAIHGEAPGKVVCKGVVVRKEENHFSEIPPVLAVSIDGYRMARGREDHRKRPN